MFRKIENLTEDLATLLYNAGYIDAENYPRTDTVSEEITGAVLNLKIVEEDRSRGVHNYKYIKGLLESSIEYMESIAPPPKNSISGVHISMLRSKTAHW